MVKNNKGELSFTFTVYLEVDFFRPEEPRAEELFLRGTFAPERLASDNPIAIACLRSFTFLPELPLRSLPSFISRIERSTERCAFFEYFLAMVYCLLASGKVYASRLLLKGAFSANDFIECAETDGLF